MPTQKRNSYGKNRRQGPDWLLRMLQWLSILGWVLFLIALTVLHYARPEFNSGQVQFHQIAIRSHWLPHLTDPLLYLLLSCCALSLIALILQRYRSRRAEDGLGVHRALLLLVSLATLLLFWPFVDS